MEYQSSTHSDQRKQEIGSSERRTLSFETELPLIDTEVFEGVKFYGQDPKFVDYLIELFEKHGGQSYDDILSAIEKKDASAVRHVAHRWRGSCLNIGASRLAGELIKLDRSDELSPDLVDLAASLRARILEIFAQSCLALRQTMNNETRKIPL